MSAKKAEWFAALLRGINVGGKNSLPMKDLAALFVKAGCGKAATYIQSGNVIFQADRVLAQSLSGVVAGAILKNFGIRAPVIIRSAPEMGQIAAGNPFLKSNPDHEKLHVAFLAAPPGRAEIQSLDSQRSPGDEFRVQGSEVYLYCPNGLGRSKLTNQYFDSKLKTTSTIRNWKTVLKLVDMLTV
jgi:uncharacterized protein (DUF1697 family)